MVVLVDTSDGGLVACRPSVLVRAHARLCAAQCDRRLASGIPPEKDVVLAVRAQRLVRASTRQWLARSLRHLLDDARRTPRSAPPPLTFECRRRIVEAEDVLQHVIDELQRPAPLSCRGLAALCQLLRDGTGPLYGTGSARELRECLGQVEYQLLPGDSL